MNINAASGTNQGLSGAPEAPWKMLVVDDEPAVHRVTHMVLADFEFRGRPVTLLEATSAAEARTLLSKHPDIALALIDVVMETTDAGLTLVRTIREELGNRLMRIVLRTGQPGYAPEDLIVHDFDISDYKEKTELTAAKLRTTVASGLRGYSELEMLATGRAQSHAAALEAREDATRAGQVQIEFLSNLSHELFTPLNAILGYAQLLQHGAVEPRQREQLGSIVTAGRSLLELLEGLLRLSGEMRSAGVPPHRSVNLRNLVNEAANLRAGDALDAGVRIHNGIPEDICVLADPAGLREILVNLLGNAVKASPSGATVRLHGAPYGEQFWRLYVSDEGPGIPPEARVHLFDLFAQAGPNRASTTGVAGIGLALARQIAQRQGMRLDIEPHSDKGATFYLDMTRAGAGSTAAAPPPDSH